MPEIERRIEQIHLQITRNCNLRCYFCGQWGRLGFFSDASGEEMTAEDWKAVISQIVRYREKTGISPFVMVWGGEPLVSPHFPQILRWLQENKLEVGMVTNGVLLDRHSQLINEAVKHIYLSLDGPPGLHDAIRGRGVFERVVSNLDLLTNPQITVMSVITPELIDQFEPFLQCLSSLGIHELYLQDMIGLTSEEIGNYKAMMQADFGVCAGYIDSWENNGRLQYHWEIDTLLTRIDRTKYPYDIIHKKHGGEENLHCLSPFRHVHVTWNGNVIYCTDFYDFKAGNVKEEELETIFLNEQSERFRTLIAQEKCVTCRHCSWKNNRHYSG